MNIYAFKHSVNFMDHLLKHRKRISPQCVYVFRAILKINSDYFSQ
jgi:hypothetical protein